LKSVIVVSVAAVARPHTWIVARGSTLVGFGDVVGDADGDWDERDAAAASTA
jgi:hypothetical protein